MADGILLPPSGTGDAGKKASTQEVTADTTHVQDVSLTSVVGGVRTRNPPLTVAPRVATTATLTNTASSASNVANLVALNTSRLGLTIFNDSSAILFLKYGTTASATSFTYEIPALSQWEMPVDPLYTGRIDAIWASANGNARITELSA